MIVSLLKDIDLDYYKGFIYTDKSGRKIMYEEAKKAIYDTLERIHYYSEQSFQKAYNKWHIREMNTTGLS